ncbi:MAG: hypothetical protein ABJE95_03495 [Byssovorax sp.]
MTRFPGSAARLARGTTAMAALLLLPVLTACQEPAGAPVKASAAPEPTRAVTPPRPAIPTMDRALFLVGDNEEPRKSRLWDLFRGAESHAKEFASSPDRFVVIERVEVGKNGALWFPSGVIQLAPNADPGTLFHEIFHTVFHRSALHAGKDESWGEGFCDAFRFVTERDLLPGPPSEWVTKVERMTSMSFDEVMAKSGDPAYDRKYAYPASVILRKTDKTTKGLRTLWFELNAAREARGGDVLDAFFGYEAVGGRPTPRAN